MKRAYKTEIKPTEAQIVKIHQTIGVSRFIYNFYIAHNKEVYEKEKRFVSGMDFSKWMNNEYIPDNQDKIWIKEVSSKAVKQAIMNGEKAFKKFFNKESGFPKFKKKKRQNAKAYFPRNNKTDWTVERHRIKIPTLGWIRLKEFGYIPVNSVITSGTVSQKADRYYLSVLVDENVQIQNNNTNSGMGIDLGIKDFAICSNMEKPFKNINETAKVKKLEKKLKREQRKLSGKYESIKLRNKNIKKGVATRQNIQKQILVVQKLHHKLGNIRENYVNEVVNKIVKTKPSYITIEDLNVKGMMKNRHLARTIAQQNFYKFRMKLQYKCYLNNIELRVVDRFYPSSRLCSKCGSIKHNLKLSDRTYICPECGYIIDRDKNAAINLADAKTYKTA